MFITNSNFILISPQPSSCCISLWGIWTKPASCGPLLTTLRPRLSESIWITSISYSCSHNCLCTAQNICPNFNYKIKLSAHNICRLIIWLRGCMHLHNMSLIYFHTYMIFACFLFWWFSACRLAIVIMDPHFRNNISGLHVKFQYTVIKFYLSISLSIYVHEC